MAINDSVILGRLEHGAFETTGRSESWTDIRRESVSVVGAIKDTFGKAKPGDSMLQHEGWFDGQVDPNYYIKTVETSSDDGVTGTIRLSLVRCPQGKTAPYSVTWDVGMEEVQMRLINHPMIIAKGDIQMLLKWEDTPRGERVKVDGGEMTFFYRGKWSPVAGFTLMSVEGDWNIAYCKAVTQGIDTFNRYLPVITKNSYYLELPGVDYSADHIITGGTIKAFTGSGSIGHYAEPELKVAGYDSQNGLWFKSGDKLTSQSDGSWVRTESWVFTNDPSHKWIYTNTL